MREARPLIEWLIKAAIEECGRLGLLDFGSVIVHVFAPDEREFYGLERLWGKAAQVVRVV